MNTDYPNINQAKFIELYLASGNATRAYQQAYSIDEANIKTAEVNASKLLRNPKVKRAMREKQLELEQELGLSKAFFLSHLKSIFLKNMDKEGQIGIALKSADLLNKMLDNYTPQKLDINTDVIITFGSTEDLEDEEDNNDEELE